LSAHHLYERKQLASKTGRCTLIRRRNWPNRLPESVRISLDNRHTRATSNHFFPSILTRESTNQHWVV